MTESKMKEILKHISDKESEIKNFRKNIKNLIYVKIKEGELTENEGWNLLYALRSYER